MIILLHKGGPRGQLNNWRPVMLLNITYKIFTRALQLRLQSIPMEIISPDQLTFLPMRLILDNILLMQEIIHYARFLSQPLLFFKLDFSKPYHKVDLCFFLHNDQTWNAIHVHTYDQTPIFGYKGMCQHKW